MAVSLIRGAVLILITTIDNTLSMTDIACDDTSVCKNGTKCFYRPCSPRDEDFVCECRQQSPVHLTGVGFDCKSFPPNIDGPITDYKKCYGSHCREGSFQSKGYPVQYRNGERAVYLLFVPGSRKITFTFEGEGGFELEPDQKDDLYVGNGLEITTEDILSFTDISTENNQVRYFHNGSVPVGQRYPPSFSFDTDTAWIYFQTDSTCDDTSVCKNETKCLYRPCSQREEDYVCECFQNSETPVNLAGVGYDCNSSPPIHVFKNCPESMVIETCNNEEKVTWTAPSFSDPSINVKSSHLPGDVFSVGIHTVSYFLSEDRLNIVENCTFKIEVRKRQTCQNSLYIIIISAVSLFIMLLVLTVCLCLCLRCKRSTVTSQDNTDDKELPVIPPRSPIISDYYQNTHPSHLYDEAPRTA